LDGGNNAIIDRLITTYQKDSFGTPDASFLDYNTLTKLAYVRWNVRGRIQKKYGSFKLAASDTKFGPGQAIMTPNIMTSELLAWYRDMEFAGIVQDFNGFQRDLVVSLSGSDPNRIDAILPVRLVNNFYIFAANIAFRF
jgi:phage tail sheath gpL-like